MGAENREERSVAENPLELLEKAFHEEVTTHPEMNDYL